MKYAVCIALFLSAAMAIGDIAFADPLAAVAAPADVAADPVPPTAATMPPLPATQPNAMLSSDPGGLAWTLVTAAKSGNWRLASAAALALLMLGLGYTPVRKKYFAGDRWGAVLVLLLGLGGGVVTALLSSAPITASLFLGSLGVAFTAAGGFIVVKRIIWPADGVKANVAGHGGTLEFHDARCPVRGGKRPRACSCVPAVLHIGAEA